MCSLTPPPPPLHPLRSLWMFGFLRKREASFVVLFFVVLFASVDWIETQKGELVLRNK